MEYLALGNFDGMHLGHKALLENMTALAKKDGATPSICIFDPHPMKLINPKKSPKLLTSISLRKKLFKTIGIKKVHIIPFDDAMMNMNGIAFLDDICAKYNVGLFALGYNYTFGKNSMWSSDDIK